MKSLRPRIVFDCSQELADDVYRLLPKGLKRYALESLVQSFVDAMKANPEHSADVLVKILRDQFLKEINFYGLGKPEEKYK